MKRDNPDRQTVPILLTVTALMAAIPLIYLTGYLWLGSPWTPRPSGRIRMRVFSSEWLAAAYQPAAWVESRIRGYPVVAGTEQDLRISSP
jgi:hypothetical protein